MMTEIEKLAQIVQKQAVQAACDGNLAGLFQAYGDGTYGAGLVMSKYSKEEGLRVQEGNHRLAETMSTIAKVCVASEMLDWCIVRRDHAGTKSAQRFLDECAKDIQEKTKADDR